MIRFVFLIHLILLSSSTGLRAANSPDAQVFISEFLAVNNRSLEDEDGDNSDWIELFNQSENPIDLEGYFLTDNPSNKRKWTFPSTIIPAAEYIVVFASGKNRREAGGELHTNFRLNEEGEYLALVLPDGETIVHDYAPGFPPQFSDTSYGMEQTIPETSTELSIPRLTGEKEYFKTPSPGQPNISGGINPGPFIRQIVDSAPRPPVGTESPGVAITAEVDTTIEPVQSITLNYRIMFGPELTLPMVDDGLEDDAIAGDGVYSVLMPTDQLKAGQMIRWRIVATDTEGRQTRKPEHRDRFDSPQYFGTVAQDEVRSSLPILHWFVSRPQGANSRTGTRGSLYYLDRFYDNILTDLHGQSTAGGAFPKKSYDIDFNRGDRFTWKEGQPKLRDINLMTNWADKSKLRHVLAYELFRDAGVPAHFAFSVRVQQNGRFFSVSDFIEDGDDKYLERAGLNPDGVLYKMYNNLSQTRTHRTQGVEKKSRKTEPNNDLGVLLGGIHRTGARLRNYLYDNLDIPKIVNFLAANSVVSNTDLHAKNYYLYRDTTGTREWCFLPWDLDLSWGRQWNSSDTYFDDSIFVDRTILAGRGNFLVRVLTDIPEIRAMVLRRIRSLSDQFLQPSSTPVEDRHFERRIAELQELIDPQDASPSDADLDFSKWRTWGNRNNMAAGVRRLLQEYLPGRRNFVFNRQAAGRGGEIPPAQNPQSVIRIGEIDFNPESGNQDEEYLELRNPNSFAVDLSDWTLTSAVDFTLKPGTVLPARGKMFISPDVNTFRGRGRSPKANEANFIQGGYKGHLSARGETVELRNAEGNLIDSLTYIGEPSQLQKYLRITEILYAPLPPTEEELFRNPNAVASDFEFIEFTNIGPEPLDLSGAAIIDGIEFTFPPESLLESGDFTLIVSNLALFGARYGLGLTLSGEFSGKLNNSGEQIRLQDASGESVLQFTYEETWHELADQSGHSLVILDPETEFNRWSEQIRWGISLNAGGSPGDIQTRTGQDFDGWKQQFFTEEEQGDSGISSFISDIDNDGLPNLLEYAYGLDPKTPDSEAILTAAIVQQDGDLFLDITYRRQKHSQDLSYTLESSENLSDWTTVQASIVETRDNSDGTERVTFRSLLNTAPPQHRFIRLKVQRTP